jgi:hypothetical protein
MMKGPETAKLNYNESINDASSSDNGGVTPIVAYQVAGIATY